IDHLGTIAKSGTKDFMSKLTGDQKADAQLIGQFGVGFYSGFIVADKITVESRRAGLKPEEGVRWISGGTGDFEVEAITRAERGTSVILHLREEALEYANAWKLKDIVGKYSDHISLPIRMEKETWKDGELIDPNNEEGGRQPGAMVKTGEWETINQASALWTRPKKDITDAQYQEFYKQISRDFEDALSWSHNRVEGSTEYTQLLYIPSKAPMDLYNRDKKAGIKLYVKRVFIMDDAEALMPTYLRWVKGVVDSADLPLNVSRELLQESRDVKAIREGNTRRVLSMLEDLAKNDKEPESKDGVTDVLSEEDKAKLGQYTKFYAEFGAALKEGLGEDFGNQARIAKLLRFASTTSDAVGVSLADYKARMKEGQEAIYYITADTLAAAKNSPQLEVFKKKGIEVLLMTDRVDEWALSFLHEFEGTPLQSVAKGAVDLGKLQDEAEKKAEEQAAEAFKPVLAKLKEALKDKAEDVRVTSRLVDSPACLVVKDEGGMSLQLARMLKAAGQKAPELKPVLEVNPEHSLVKKLDGSVHFHDLAHILFDQALLAEGGLPEDPAAYVKRVNALLA
ncbi:MAG: Chaperone protein HtpG, partial [Pseudomonadota bacterium]